MLKKPLGRTTGILCISTTLNNTFITLTDAQGRVLVGLSSGALGFKGSKKASSYAAQATLERVWQLGQKHGLGALVVRCRGVGYAKDAVLKALVALPLPIVQLEEVSQRAYNGCRPAKRRRV